jgi:hypothetical protein
MLSHFSLPQNAHCSVIFHCYSAHHFSLLWCSAIPLTKGAQSFFNATVLSYFSLLQYSVVFHCYGTWPFAMLQYKAIPRYKSTRGSLVILQNDRAQSRVGAGDSRLDRGCVGSSHARCRVTRDRATQGKGSRGARVTHAGVGRIRNDSIDRPVG